MALPFSYDTDTADSFIYLKKDLSVGHRPGQDNVTLFSYDSPFSTG